METFLFEKVVDQSLLKWGLTVPKEFCDKILAVLGVKLNKGEQVEITVKMDDKTYLRKC